MEKNNVNIKKNLTKTESSQVIIKDDKNILGKLIFTKTNNKIPLIEGTDRQSLDRGAGHYSESVMPGDKGNCIIFGHRETAFKYLKNTKIDDIIQIETKKGIFKYKVYEIKIVRPDDEYILKLEGDSIMTMVTCFPFNLIGSAPKRYVVKAKYTI